MDRARVWVEPENTGHAEWGSNKIVYVLFFFCIFVIRDSRFGPVE